MAHNQYVSFYATLHFIPYPVHEEGLHLFVVSLTCCFSPQSITTYLSGIHYFNIQYGHGDPIPGMLRLKTLLRGIKRGL